MKVSNNNTAKISVESIETKLSKFKAEHEAETDAKLFHVYTVREAEFFAMPALNGNELKALGMRHSSKFKCYYWHNQFESGTPYPDDQILSAFMKKPNLGFWDESVDLY